MYKIIIVFTFLFSNIAFSQYTEVPDEKFEQALIYSGFDDVLDGKILSSKVKDIEVLNVNDLGIVYLDGIEAFVNLEVLHCKKNKIGELNLSNNKYLKELKCEENELIKLDLSKNVNIESVYCSYNRIFNIDVSNNPLLKSLVCEENNLREINISNNNNLTKLYLGINALTTIDVSNCTNLSILDCNSNELTELDLRANKKLSDLFIYNNEALQYLNIQYSNLTIYEGSNTPMLTCVKVKDANYANSKYTDKDAVTTFNIDCNNPIKTSISKPKAAVVSNAEINNEVIQPQELIIKNTNGKIIYTGNINDFQVKDLSTGNYSIEVK